MKTTDNKRLCIELAQAECESEVIDVLKKVGLWTNSLAWKDYDNNPNNFSTIGNQQSSPDTALVEKIINSVDAVLMRECLRRKINPQSENAPQSIAEALKDFLDIYEGKLSNIDSQQRAKQAENILLVATGQKSNPCYFLQKECYGMSRQMPDPSGDRHLSDSSEGIGTLKDHSPLCG